VKITPCPIENSWDICVKRGPERCVKFMTVTYGGHFGFTLKKGVLFISLDLGSSEKRFASQLVLLAVISSSNIVPK
jgi:hypothetical protein